MSTLFVNERVNPSKRIKGNWSTHLSLSNIPRKEVSAAPKRNKPGQETKYPKQLIQEAVPKEEVPRACTSEHASQCTACTASQCLPCTCTARGYHPLVGLIPSTLRRDLRSLNEIPSTLRRNLRSIAMSFFLPCEHNNRKADRIAFLNTYSPFQNYRRVPRQKPLCQHLYYINSVITLCIFFSKLGVCYPIL